MKITSGATSLHDIQREAGQKRRLDDRVSSGSSQPYQSQVNRLQANQPRPLSDGRHDDEKTSPLVEQVVEGEFLGHGYGASVETVLRFDQSQEDASFGYKAESSGAKTHYALDQYRSYGFSEDEAYGLRKGHQVDLYV